MRTLSLPLFSSTYKRLPTLISFLTNCPFYLYFNGRCGVQWQDGDCGQAGCGERIPFYSHDLPHHHDRIQRVQTLPDTAQGREFVEICVIVCISWTEAIVYATDAHTVMTRLFHISDALFTLLLVMVYHRCLRTVTSHL